MSDRYDQVTTNFNKLIKATNEKPEFIRLCQKCYNEFGENIGDDGYPQNERDVVLTVAFGAKVVPTAFPVLCFHCGSGYKMTEEWLLFRNRSKESIKKRV